MGIGAATAAGQTGPNVAPVLTNPGNQTSGTVSPYAQAVLADAPAAYWRLGETAGSTAADSAGASAGTVFGGVTLNQSGALADGNPAMLFNGSTGYVRGANPAASLAGDLTIELWLNVSLATRQTLISKSNLSEFELTLETWGQLNFYQGNGTTFEEIPLTFAGIAANTWQHVVVTRTAATNTIRLYVNGILKGSRTYTTAATASARLVSIGRSDSGAKYVNGRLDEVALYPAALSGVQVAAHYAQRTAIAIPAVVALQLLASDPNGDPLTYSATGLPVGLTINTATGLISGTFIPASGGVHPVTVTAFDGSLSASQSFTWTVTGLNAAPALMNPGNQTNGTVSPYAQAVLADAPAAYWRLGETAGSTAADSAGASAGTVFGGVTLSQGGALADGNPAMLFNGSTGYVRGANPAASLAGDLTIELWLNVSLATRQTLISKSNLSEFELTLETWGQLNFYQGNGTTFEEIPLAFAGITANTWQHVVVTRTAATNTIRLYVNGILKGSRTYTTAATASARLVSIGRSDGGAKYVNGRLDEVALYPAALSGVQVAAHYAQRTAIAIPAVVALQLLASDPNGDPLTYSATGLPVGLTINTATGLISGTFIPASGGVHPVTVTAFDGSLSTSQAFTWTVTTVNHAPALTNPGTQTSAENTGISLQLTASDPDADALIYSASGLPSSLTLNSATGLISGTLSYSSAGSYLVTATVSDGGLSSSQTFSWTVTNVNRPPTLRNPGSLTNGFISGYAQAVLADAPAAYWRLGETAGSTAADSAGASAGTVFGGVTLNQSGALADGNPAMLFNGSTGYVRGANPAASLAGDLTIELWLNVSLATRQTLISKSNLSEFELTLETWGQLNFYQGNGTTFEEIPLTFAGITANTWQHVVVTRTAATNTIRLYVNGILKGSRTYTTAATASARLVSIGRSDSGAKYVNGRLDEVALYPAALSGVQVAAHYAQRTSVGSATVVALPLAGSDPDGDALTYSATGLPPGLTINTATGHISGTLSPTSAGTYQVTITVSDGSFSTSQTFTWTVAYIDSTVPSSDPAAATLTYPANGATSIDQSQTATWTPVVDAQAYYFYVGTTPGGQDIIDSGETLLTGFPIAGLLPAGPTLYARIWTKVAGSWRYRDSTFTASPFVPQFVNPTDGAVAVNPSTAFTWIAPANSTAHQLLVGTTPGANELFDSGQIGATSVAVSGLPPTGTLYARVSSRVGAIWRHTDIAFTLEASPALPTMIAPYNGQVGFQTALPFEWSAVPLAHGYRLTIGTTPGGTNLLDSGVIHVTRRFVPGLPPGLAYGRLQTEIAGQWYGSDFTFSVGVNTLPDLRIKNALWATDVVRQMASADNRPFSWTMLSDNISPRVMAAGSDYAATLLQALTEMNVQLSARRLDVTFDTNGYDGHTLVELFDSITNRWILLDPTFDLTMRRLDGTFATAEDVSQATRTGNWGAIAYEFIEDGVDAYVRSYYLDYPLLFANVYHQGQIPVLAQGVPVLPFLEPVGLPSVDATQTFMIRCESPTVVNATIGGLAQSLPCNGVDSLTPGFIGTVAAPAEGQPVFQLYRVPRNVF